MSNLYEAKIPNRRLDSWKEIAAFFRRDERTVKRWEKDRRLPVHRLQGSATGRVYAYSEELLQWMNSPVSAESVTSRPEPAGANVDSLAESLAAGAVEAPVKPAQEGVNLRRRASDRVPPARRGLLLGALVLVALLVATGGFVYYRQTSLGSIRPQVPEGKTAAATHTPNPEARDFYLKGRYEWDKRTPESLNKAVDYFTQAIVHDPNYAQAYVGLADCYNLLREYSAMAPEEAYPRALAAARKAVELDDSSAEAHTSLAFVTFYWNFDAAGAEQEFRRALALNPNDARAHHWYATFLFSQGHYREALTQIEAAQQIDPASTSVLADKGLILLYAGSSDQGMAILKQLGSTDPAFPSSYRYLESQYLINKDYPAFLEARKKAAELVHNDNDLVVLAAAERGLARGQRQGMFQGMLEEQEKLYAEGQLSAYELASTHGLLGNKAKALEYLQRAYDHHEPELTSMRNNIAFDGLRGDPAFRKLEGQAGLPALP